MLRRILVLGGIATATVLGARFALGAIDERAWTRRRSELTALALAPASARRPWEVRFEALAERARTSTRLRELDDSAHKPFVALGAGEPRALDELERLWLTAAEHELAGLEGILAELRRLPPATDPWNGATVKLLFLREVTNVLCAQAWPALEARDGAGAARRYGDALRLAQATDDGTGMGTAIRETCQVQITLRSLRAALAFGADPGVLRAELAPILATWSYSGERAERGIRRELHLYLQPGAGQPEDPVSLLQQFQPVEAAIELARLPLADTPWVRGEPFERGADGCSPLALWTMGAGHRHALHAAGNVALTALALADFRARHGAFPAALEELADLPLEQRLDPATGKSLLYALTSAGATLGPVAWPRAEPEQESDGRDSLFSWTLR